MKEGQGSLRKGREDLEGLAAHAPRPVVEPAHDLLRQRRDVMFRKPDTAGGEQPLQEEQDRL